ncbi:MAG TPA: flippase-like domain-containing protein [Bacteroides sp.]|nr:flippase-like domain-containing protein [Bacteroides sp.]
MDKKKTRAILFFFVGAGLFWIVYRDMDLNELGDHLSRLKWWWIGVSVMLNLFSHLIKAFRWQMLITPLGYAPGIGNLFLSNLVLAFTNLVIPRGGEFARLGVVNRFEKIPFSKLLGTALAERLTDLILLVLIAGTLIVWQFDNFIKILKAPEISMDAMNIRGVLIVILVSAFLGALFYFLFLRPGRAKNLKKRLRKFWNEMAEGFMVLSRIKGLPLYLFYSLLQYVLWFLMLYVIFFAFPPTTDLSFSVAAFTFGFATLAFLLPVQAGIGAWHFVVIQCLMLFGIQESTGQIFALIAHSFSMLIHLVTGAIAFVTLPLVNRE